ncbi:MAG: AAA family ATPase [Gammaproteobacteria bacterium]|nr:MAG: ATP-binding protein [Gammaproteobacteria bacterium]UCH41172.1 MAG: AAA family ATPase [Gammaproteobacteria bacterium]
MASKKIKPLDAKSLYHGCDLKSFDFKTTAELEPLDQPVGQARALEAIEFGVDIEQQGFNLFVVGDPGIGKQELVRQILSHHARKTGTQSDWCYVNNFDNPQKPRLLKLPAGMGQKLRQDMESLVEDLLTSLPSSFQSEEYRNRRQEIEQELQNRQDDAFRKLDREAEEKGIIIMRTPTGYTMGPMVDGRPLDPQEYAKLSDEEKARIEELIAELQQQLQDIIREMPLVQREHHQRIKALNQEITQHTVEQLIAWMENSYRDYPEVMDYLQAVQQNAIKDVEAFLPSDRGGETDNIASRVAGFHAYSINVIVDNTDMVGAPVVFEDHPTYQNLIGRVEYISQMGTLITNFTLIKPGALHRANGGYLVLDAHKLLTHAFAWEGLKRALKSREIKIQSLEQMLSLANTVSLEPESIPFEVKVVLTGEPRLYYLLRALDHEFDQLFKVAADFARTAKRENGNMRDYARMIAAVQSECDARPLDRGAIGRMIEEASRAADDAEKLSLHLGDMRDLLSEANYWARKDDSEIIAVEHVEKAISKQDYRQDRYRELMQEQVLRGIKMIDTEGERVAQVNALSVLQTGRYRFGQASRITATARLGRAGVVDIEREAKLGGDLHSKGVMILSSYLAHHYAANQPLPLAASLAFEQSYGTVDGDSASAAELCVLLSALGEIPLKQSLAVTGSINQLGEMQAVGGVNEKIEGFFEICQSRGLTGKQGVIIPAANQVHLMLHKDVREAVEEGKFSIYPARQVAEVMQLLSGLKPGKADDRGRYPEGSFDYLIQQRIEKLQSAQKRFMQRSSSDESASANENES